MGAVLLIQDSSQRAILVSKTVQEVRDKNPHAVRVDGLLQARPRSCEKILKPVLRNAVQKRNFFDNLMNRCFNWGMLPTDSPWHMPKIQGHSCVSVGELLDILSRCGQSVVVVEIAESAE